MKRILAFAVFWVLSVSAVSQAGGFHRDARELCKNRGLLQKVQSIASTSASFCTHFQGVSDPRQALRMADQLKRAMTNSYYQLQQKCSGRAECSALDEISYRVELIFAGTLQGNAYLKGNQ